MAYVPIVDILADQDVAGAELDEICRTVGFFPITGPRWIIRTATSRWPGSR